MRLFAVLAVSFSCLLISSCSHKAISTNKLSVYVSILPEKYFVDKIGKDLVTVSVLVPPGASPHSYEPKPSQMAGISRASLLFTIGIEFEKAWVPRIQNVARDLKIIPIDSGIQKIPMAEHDHGEMGGEREKTDATDHDHEGLDPHIWLSPELVKMQALTIMQGLSLVDSVHKEIYHANYNQFIIQIDSLQRAIKAALADCPKPVPFMVFHPSWGYFAREFDGDQIAIEISGKEPSPREMVSIMTKAKEKHIKTIFTQPQFSPRSAEQIAHELGAQVTVADDLAENWEENLLKVATMIGKCK